MWAWGSSEIGLNFSLVNDGVKSQTLLYTKSWDLKSYHSCLELGPL